MSVLAIGWFSPPTHFPEKEGRAVRRRNGPGRDGEALLEELLREPTVLPLVDGPLGEAAER